MVLCAPARVTEVSSVCQLALLWKNSGYMDQLKSEAVNEETGCKHSARNVSTKGSHFNDVGKLNCNCCEPDSLYCTTP